MQKRCAQCNLILVGFCLFHPVPPPLSPAFYYIFIQIVIEVLLGQGKIIEALRMANTLSGTDTLSARKYLEAAKKTNDRVVFYSVYTWFQHRNIRQRGQPDFLKCKRNARLSLPPFVFRSGMRFERSHHSLIHFQPNCATNTSATISSCSSVDLYAV